MILNVSGRCDVVNYYTTWFMNRYRSGYLDVRNPYNRHLVSRIYFEDVDLIVFCTKNPLPILSFIREIDIPILFHITITPYGKDIEPNVIDKGLVIEGVKELSKILGKDRVVVRYDPIFLSDKYDISYHLRAFEKLCLLLNGYVKTIIVSFIDIYKNVKSNISTLKLREFTEEDYRLIGEGFSKIAGDMGIDVQTCFEERNLCEYGFKRGECLSLIDAYKITGKVYDEWTSRKERKCKCAKMVDVGEYNMCRNFCKYCYANFDEKRVRFNMERHNPDSSLIMGEIEKGDIIKRRYK